MRPTFMGLETAKRGLMVNQKAMDIIGNNISNLETKGYTRQRLDTVSVQVYGTDRFNHSSVPLAGQGVDARGVSQIRNPYLDSKFRQQYSEVGYYDQKAAVMEQVEAVLSDPEVDGSGIMDALAELSQALADFSVTPDGETHANIVMNAFKSVTQILNEYDSGLKTVISQTKDDLAAAVDDINSSLAQLSELNRTIAHEVFVNDDYDGVNYGPNDLLDQRNLILDDLSRYGKIEVNSLDQGRIQVKLDGKVVVDAAGGSYTNDSLRLSNDGTSLAWASDGKATDLGKGAIAGFLETLTGDNAITPGIPYYQRQLDNFANSFANVFNNIVHDDDSAFPDRYKFLLEGDAGGRITAASISVSSKWSQDPSYIIRKNNPDGSGDNTDIAEMKKALSKDYDFGGEFTGTFNEFITFYTGTLGSNSKTNSNRLETALTMADSIDSDRMGVSGVSLNEEGINMMTYNKAYQAIGRLMTTMDEQLDMIINQMGLVGR